MDSIVFEVDCGEVMPGHRLVATGLRYDGFSDDATHADYAGHAPGRPVHAMASLTYRVFPAMTEAGTGRDIDARVSLNPPADPALPNQVQTPGGARAASRGSEVTLGAFGPFIVPEQTVSVTVHLTDAAVSVGPAGVRSSDPERVVGDVVVDLRARTARWEPAREGIA